MILLLSLMTPPAFADDDALTRRTRRTVDVELAERAAETEAAKLMATEKRHLEMEAAERLLSENRTLSSDQRADLMLRLADLYFREGRALYLDEMVPYLEAVDACFNDPTCENIDTVQADHGVSSEWHSKSIRLYRIILDNYPHYPRADEAQFYLASALDDLERNKEALQEYTRLARNYPESVYAPNAYMMIGELEFEDGDVYRALLAYKKTAAFRHHEYYSLALYKLSWCYYNVGEYGLALDTLKRVITWTDDQLEGQDDRGAFDLREDAYRDLVRFCADGGDLDECVHFVKARGRDDLVRDTMVRLGSTYLEQGKNEEAMRLYKRLISSDPKHLDAAGYQVEIVQVSLRMGRVEETVDELERLRRDHGPTSSWAQANAVSIDAVKEVQTDTAKAIANTALEWQKEARRLGTGPRARRLYAASDALYGVYRSDFPDGAHLYDVTFAHAELQYATKQKEAAFASYMAVVALDPKGRSSLFSAEAAIKTAGVLAGTPDDPDGAQIIPLDVHEANYLRALDQYAELYPDGEKRQFALYKAAWLLYHHNDFAQAAERFRVVIALDPSAREAEYAANLILDSLALVEDWDTLRTTALAFYEMEGLGDETFKQSVASVYERASFKVIEVARDESGDDVAAAESFIRFAAEFPMSEVADLALNNAAVWLGDAGRRDEAMALRLRVIQEYPDSRFVSDALRALAYDHEAIGQFERSADLYERFAMEYPRSEAAPAALYTASVFREALGQDSAALRDIRTLLTLDTDRDDAALLSLRAARLLRDSGDEVGARRVYTRMLSTELEPELKMLTYLELSELSEDPVSVREEALSFFAAQASESAQVTEIAGRLRFEQSERDWLAYTALRIPGPSTSGSPRQQNEVLAEQLRAKSTALQGVEAHVGAVIETGSGPWGVAALVRLGQAYEDFALTLEESWVPDYLSDEQQELYRQDLADRAALVRLKAQTAYEAAMEQAIRLDVYDASAMTARVRLQALDPDGHPPTFEAFPSRRWTSGVTVRADYEEEL